MMLVAFHIHYLPTRCIRPPSLPSLSPIMSGTVDTPCRSETLMWRECLKGFDYGPERPDAECNRERVRYYACMKEWRTTQDPKKAAAVPDTSNNVVKGSIHPSTAPTTGAAAFHATMPGDCTRFSNALHNCMMISAFEAAKCRDEMLHLRVCASKYDKSVARALEEDVQMGRVVLKFDNDPDDSTGIKRVWNKIIGKI